MTTLVVEPLINTLYQEIRYNLNERLHVGAFIPYLYLHNAQADYFTIELRKGLDLIYSKQFTVADIKASLSTLDNYIHVFYPVIPINPVQIEAGLYTLNLIAGPNYVSNSTSFMGWVKQHDDLQNEMEYIPTDDSQNSFSIRYKCYKEGVL